MTDRPLMGATVALVAGILAAFLWPPCLWLLLGMLLLLSLVFLLTRRRLWEKMALLALFALGGAYRLQQVSTIPAGDISRYAPLYITATGVVDSDVSLIADKTSGTPYAANFELDSRRFEIQETSDTKRNVSVSGRVSVRIPISDKRNTNVSQKEQDIAPLHYGDTVIVTGRLEVPTGPRNPGAFDDRAYLARKNIYATLTVHRSQDWERIAEPGFRGNLPTRLAYTLREGVRNHTRRVFSPERAEVLNGRS